MKPEILPKLLLLLLGTLVGWLALEVAVSALKLDRPAIYFKFPIYDKPSLRYHPVLGWVNLSDITYRDKDTSYRINKNGFRFPEDYTRKKSARYRLAVLGDSQAFGLFVPMEEYFAYILDKRVQELEVYPFAVPGYGPTQELLLLKSTVLDYSPDRLLVVMFLENDLIDETLDMNHGYKQKPYVSPSGGELEILNIPVPVPVTSNGRLQKRHLIPRRILFEWSGAFRSLVYAASMNQDGLSDALKALGLVKILDSSHFNYRKGFLYGYGFSRFDGLEIECAHAISCPRRHLLDGLPAAIKIYREMNRICAERGIEFEILVTPSAMEMKGGLYGTTRRVVGTLRQEGLTVIDFSAHVISTGAPSETFIGKDLHWNSKGHMLAADAIEREIVSKISLHGN